jgi:hypothetical protein
MTKHVSLCPCATFFKAGKTVSGIIALLMQLSVVFWPAAVAWAQEYEHQTAIASALADYATKYPVPMSVLVDQYRFRTRAKFAQQRECQALPDRAALV